MDTADTASLPLTLRKIKTHSGEDTSSNLLVVFGDIVRTFHLGIYRRERAWALCPESFTVPAMKSSSHVPEARCHPPPGSAGLDGPKSGNHEHALTALRHGE